MEKKSDNHVHRGNSEIPAANTDPRPSQPGLSPSGQVRGQIGSVFGRTGCSISLRLLPGIALNESEVAAAA